MTERFDADADADADGVVPSRIAVCGPQSDGGWDGCETINAFRFTGVPDIDMMRDHADRPLRDLHAEEITAHTLMTPQFPGTTAVRSSGCFSIAGLWIWAQYSTYIAGSALADQGQLIQHSVFIESGCRARLSDSVTQLSDAIYQAFLANIGTCSSQIDASPGFRDKFRGCILPTRSDDKPVLSGVGSAYRPVRLTDKLRRLRDVDNRLRVASLLMVGQAITLLHFRQTIWCRQTI